jgi:hypothetical protein
LSLHRQQIFWYLLAVQPSPEELVAASVRDFEQRIEETEDM